MNGQQTIPKAPSRIGLSFALNNLRRAMWEEFLDRNFSTAVREEYFNEFRNSKTGRVHCFYCNSEEVKRWDHVVPVTCGGATVKGNLVPACGACDDSKGRQPVEEWLESDKPQAQKRRENSGARPNAVVIKELARIRTCHRFEAAQLEGVLPPATYTAIRECIKNLERIRIDLIEHRNRPV
jgi:hypothetical protein